MRDGDQAGGQGYVVLAGEGANPVLCDLEIGPLPAGQAVTCSGPKVRLTGVDVSALPDWAESGGSWRSARVEVIGRWLGGRLEVEQVRKSITPEGQSVPCDPPAEGWPDAADANAREAASRLLSEEVEGNPDSYSGMSTAVALDGQSVVVVGTVDDASATQQRLEAIYPFALCIVSVPYSRAPLLDAAERLRAASRDWTASIDSSSGRVRVKVGVADEAAIRAIEPYGDIAFLDPLVRPLQA